MKGDDDLDCDHPFDVAMRKRAEQKKRGLPKDFGTLTPGKLDAFLDGFHKKLAEGRDVSESTSSPSQPLRESRPSPSTLWNLFLQRLLPVGALAAVVALAAFYFLNPSTPVQVAYAQFSIDPDTTRSPVTRPLTPLEQLEPVVGEFAPDFKSGTARLRLADSSELSGSLTNAPVLNTPATRDRRYFGFDLRGKSKGGLEVAAVGTLSLRGPVFESGQLPTSLSETNVTFARFTVTLRATGQLDHTFLRQMEKSPPLR